MSSILTNPARRQETEMGPALRRAVRYGILAIVAATALFSVLAVKAQMLPAPHWKTWPGCETHR